MSKELLKFQLKQKILSKRKKTKLKSNNKTTTWLYPIGIEKQYFKLIKNIINKFINITNNKIKPLLGIWKEQHKLLDNNINIDFGTKEYQSTNQRHNLIDWLEKENVKDSPTDDLNNINQEFNNIKNEEFGSDNESLKAALLSIIISVFTFNDKQFQKAIKSTTGSELFVQEPWREELVKQWVANNINLITNLSDEYIKKINNAILDAFQNNKTASYLSNELTKINKEFSNGKTKKVFRTAEGKIIEFDLKEFNQKMLKDPAFIKRIKALRGQEGITEIIRNTQSRSDLIARDQLSKLNGQVTKRRQQEIGLTIYKWNTALDERVRGRPGGLYPNARPSHWVLEGKFCSWGDSTIYADTLEEAIQEKWKKRSSIGAVEEHPQIPINCRCSGEAVFTDILNEVNGEVF